MKVLLPFAALLAVVACGDFIATPASTPAPAAAPEPVRTAMGEHYLGNVILVTDGELACPTIGTVISERLGDSSPTPCAKDFTSAQYWVWRWDTRVVFIDFHWWSKDQKTVADFIAYVRGIQDPTVADLPIVLFSHDERLEAEALAMGANDFIVLPKFPNVLPSEALAEFADVAWYYTMVAPPPEWP